MSMLRTVTLAAALIASAASPTMAQNGPGGANSNNGMPPNGYLGPGAFPSYKSSDFQRGNQAANPAASGGRPLYSRGRHRILQRASLGH
jgi:hypothetical protein